MRRLRDPQMTPEGLFLSQTLEGEAMGRFPALMKKSLLSPSLSRKFSGAFLIKGRKLEVYRSMR